MRRPSCDQFRSAPPQRGEQSIEDFILRSVAVHHDESFRLGSGEREISLADAAMKLEIFGFEAAFVLRRAHIARSSATQTHILGQVEEDREIRLQRARGPVIQHAKSIEIEQASKSLVR